MNWKFPDPIYRAGWFRLWPLGPGIAWTEESPNFSERIGVRKPFIVIKGWRFFFVRGWKL